MPRSPGVRGARASALHTGRWKNDLGEQLGSEYTRGLRQLQRGCSAAVGAVLVRLVWGCPPPDFGRGAAARPGRGHRHTGWRVVGAATCGERGLASPELSPCSPGWQSGRLPAGDEWQNLVSQ